MKKKLTKTYPNQFHRCTILGLFFSIIFSWAAAQVADTVEAEYPAENVAPPTEEAPTTVQTVAPGDEIHYFSPIEEAGPPFHPVRTAPPENIRRLKSSDAFWYADGLARPEPKKQRSRPFINSSVFEFFLWIIIICTFVALIILVLEKSNIRLFRKSRKISQVMPDNDEYDNIFEINYEAEIGKAVAARDFRTAVRLMFLQLLKQMADRNIIRYHSDQTNFDYLRQLSNTSYYEGFFRLTRQYEYSWYGLFNIDSNTFNVIEKDFREFITKLNTRH